VVGPLLKPNFERNLLEAIQQKSISTFASSSIVTTICPEI